MIIGFCVYGGKMKRSSNLTWYGNVSIQKGWCSKCQYLAFVIDNKLQCCDAPYKQPIKSVKRETSPEYKRKQISKGEKKKILNDQNYRCFYCEQEFGSIKKRRDREFVLRIHFDHIVPFAYSQNNHVYNFVAACNVCNLIKSSSIYESLDDAKLKIQNIRQNKGYNF
jgi:5-methylcytosine-specific restriction endonuclease McrA